MFKEYPKMIYPPGKDPVVVQNAEEAAAILGKNADPNRLPKNHPASLPELEKPRAAIKPIKGKVSHGNGESDNTESGQSFRDA